MARGSKEAVPGRQVRLIMHDFIWMFGMVFSALWVLISVIQVIKGYVITYGSIFWLAVCVVVQLVAWKELGINPLV